MESNEWSPFEIDGFGTKLKASAAKWERNLRSFGNNVGKWGDDVKNWGAKLSKEVRNIGAWWCIVQCKFYEQTKVINTGNCQCSQ